MSIFLSLTLHSYHYHFQRVQSENKHFAFVLPVTPSNFLFGHPDMFLHLNLKLYHCICVSLYIITFVSIGDSCFFCDINNSMLKLRNVKSTYTFSMRQIKVIIWDSLHCIVQQGEKNSFSPLTNCDWFWGGSWYTWRVWILRVCLSGTFFPHLYRLGKSSETQKHVAIWALVVFFMSSTYLTSGF